MISNIESNTLGVVWPMQSWGLSPHLDYIFYLHYYSLTIAYGEGRRRIASSCKLILMLRILSILVISYLKGLVSLHIVHVKLIPLSKGEIVRRWTFKDIDGCLPSYLKRLLLTEILPFISSKLLDSVHQLIQLRWLRQWSLHVINLLFLPG